MAKIKLIICGYRGHMGQVVNTLASESDDYEVVAGFDRIATQKNDTIPIFSDFATCNVDADIIIDFSSSFVTDKLLDYCTATKTPLVLCTTGLSEATELKVIETSKVVPVFKSANMSLGINIINNLLKKVSPLLYDTNFDIEIIEKHHNQKVDAPSGTAYLLADSIRDSLDSKPVYNYDRSQTREKRTRNEIGMHALRGGTIVGEHSVIYAGQNEVIEFKHEAHSREVFANGAVNAGRFIVNKEAGIYDMDNLVNELI